MVWPHARVLTGNGRNVAPGQKDHVIAESCHLSPLPGTEAFTQADQQQQRSHPPGNTEHGQEGAQFMRPDCIQNLPDNVPESAHVPNGRVRSPSESSSMPAPSGESTPYFLSSAARTSPAFGELTRRYSLTRFRSSFVSVGATASRRRMVVATSST